jgi:hypothetical protein
VVERDFMKVSRSIAAAGTPFDASKRTFMKQAGFGAGSLALSAAGGGALIAVVVPDPSCSKPSIEIEVSTAITFLKRVSDLLPNQSGIVGKIVAALDSFNKAYQAGDFDSAGNFFDSVDSLFAQFTSDLGVNIPASVKIAMALVDAAIAGIAVLLKSKAPAAMPAKMSPGQQKGASAVDRRAAHAEALFAAIHQ